MVTETSTFLVRHFPRALRQQIHGLAGLEGKRVHEIVVRLLEQALAQAAKRKERP